MIKVLVYDDFYATAIELFVSDLMTGAKKFRSNLFLVYSVVNEIIKYGLYSILRLFKIIFRIPGMGCPSAIREAASSAKARFFIFSISQHYSINYFFRVLVDV